MFAALARLFILRPLFSLAVLGIPVVILIAIGLITIWAVKFFVFIVLPIALVVWVLRRLFSSPSNP